MTDTSSAPPQTGGWHQDGVPGILLSIHHSGGWIGGAWLVRGIFPIPALVVALFAGIAAHSSLAVLEVIG